MSKLAITKYNPQDELELIKLEIKSPLLRKLYENVCRLQERHDLGITDDKKTAIGLKGEDIKLKQIALDFMYGNKPENRQKKLT